MNSGSVSILGVFVADATFRAKRMPKMGETIIGRSFALGPGGKGSNQAVASARAGAKVRFIAKLGRDTFGEMALALWKDAGVEPKIIWDEDGSTGAASIFVDDDAGDNAIIICPGAAGTMTTGDVEFAREDIIGSSVFLTQLEQPIEAAEAGLSIAKASCVRTILNPAPVASIPHDMVRLCDFVTPNETEAEGMTGVVVDSVDNANRAARDILKMGAGAALITMGENGSLYVDNEISRHIPAMAAGPVVETTGAGDAFNGGFATALSEGLDAITAAKFATATAAISVTRAGAAGSMPLRDDIDALIAKSTP